MCSETKADTPTKFPDYTPLYFNHTAQTVPGPDAQRYPGRGPARLYLHDFARLSIPCRRRLQRQCRRDGARRLRLIRDGQCKLDHYHFRQRR